MNPSFQQFLDTRGYLAFRVGIFDLDHTLYAYPPCNDHATAMVCVQIGRDAGMDVKRVRAAYAEARDTVHHRLRGTAAMHSRFLYIQRTLESLRGHTFVTETDRYHAMFWQEYFSRMVVYPWVRPFFMALQRQDIRIAILTNLTAEIQFQKLQRLELQSFIHTVVSSEEVGQEKPAAAMLHHCLQKLGVQARECFLVGDAASDRLGESAGVSTFLIEEAA